MKPKNEAASTEDLMKRLNDVIEKSNAQKKILEKILSHLNFQHGGGDSSKNGGKNTKIL